MSLTRPSGARQYQTDTQCRHSREPFDCLFCCVAERRDLSDGAKLLHATLVSQHRTGYAWTQTEIGRRIGASRQKVWRLTKELVAAGLLLTVRIGLGRPNEYVLLGIAPEDLDGTAPRSARPAAGHQEVRPRNTPARAFNSSKERGKTIDYRGVRTSGFLETREGHYHDVIRR